MRTLTPPPWPIFRSTRCLTRQSITAVIDEQSGNRFMDISEGFSDNMGGPYVCMSVRWVLGENATRLAPSKNIQSPGHRPLHLMIARGTEQDEIRAANDRLTGGPHR